MPVRFLVTFALLCALAPGAGLVFRATAQNLREQPRPLSPSFREASDRFVMPRIVERSSHRPIEVENFATGADGETTTRVKNTRPLTFAAGPSPAYANLPPPVVAVRYVVPAHPAQYRAAPRPFVPLSPANVINDNYCNWCWQVLPDGLLYKSYMAGTRESRISGALLYDTSDGWLLDSTLGGRVGILRYGSSGAGDPRGWQLDIEAAAFIRQNIDEEVDVDSVDFRFGVPLTYRRGPWQWKTGYYHLSAHVGDEFLVRNPGFQRINYVRDSLTLGLGYYLDRDVRLYGEVGWAFKTDGGAEPWEFQFGADYSPDIHDGLQGAPFAAVNVNLREEVDYGGGINLMAGWRWRGPLSGSTLRLGAQYYNGKKMQYSFFDEHEELIGFGLWYDY